MNTFNKLIIVPFLLSIACLAMDENPNKKQKTDTDYSQVLAGLEKLAEQTIVMQSNIQEMQACLAIQKMKNSEVVGNETEVDISNIELNNDPLFCIALPETKVRYTEKDKNWQIRCPICEDTFQSKRSLNEAQVVLKRHLIAKCCEDQYSAQCVNLVQEAWHNNECQDCLIDFSEQKALKSHFVTHHTIFYKI